MNNDYNKRLRDDWAVALSFIQRIINRKRHSTTKVAPYEIVFGALAPFDPLILHPFARKYLFEKRILTAWSDKMLRNQRMVSYNRQELVFTRPCVEF